MLNLLNSCRAGPLLHHPYFLIIHPNPVLGDSHSEEFYLLLLEEALLGFQEQIVLLESVQNRLDYLVVLCFGDLRSCENYDVIDVDDDACLEVAEDVVHHRLEGGWGVSLSEKHDGGLIGFSSSDKGRLPFIFLLDLYVGVPGSEVQLREPVASLELVYELSD